MQTQEQTSKQYFRSLTVIFSALLMGQLLFGTMISVINTHTPILEGVKNADVLNASLLIVVALLMIFAIVLGRVLSKAKLKAAKEKPALDQKLNAYRSLTIIRLAFLQAPVFVALISFMLTGNWVFFGLAGLVITIFVMHAPSKNKLADELELSQSDRKLIEDPMTVVTRMNRSAN